MPDREDRGNKNRLLLGWGFFVIVLAVAAGAYLGWRANTLPKGAETPKLPVPFSAPTELPRQALLLPVKLYYPVNDLLVPGIGQVKRQPDTQSQARETLAVFLSDERASQIPVVKDVKIRDLYLDESGTAFVDLALGEQAEVKASAAEELLGFYALVQTLTTNFEEIKQVMFLIDGREAKSLAGHVDLSRKFVKRNDLVKQ